MNNKCKKLPLLLGIAVGVVTQFSGYCWAADGPASSENKNVAADGPKLEEIIVTATRRSTRLLDTPVSVTSLTTKNLQDKQVTDVLTLAKFVPGMESKPTLSPLEISVAIRGVTQLIPSLSEDPAIGTYVDGVYNVINAGSNTAMIDMQSVDVDKGPQGTLFGRNTIGGAIDIKTIQPTDKFGGYLEGGLGNYDAKTVTGAINVPVASKIDARVAFEHSDHDGYGRNFTTGHPTSTLNQNFVRATVRIKPSDAWDIRISGYFDHANGYNYAENMVAFDPAGASLGPGLGLNSLVPTLSGKPGDLISNYVVAPGSQNTYSNHDGFFLLKQYGFTGTITGQLNDVISVKSITGMIHTDYNTVTDVDGTPYEILALTSYPIHARQYSEELQAYGDVVNLHLHWITGLYYFQIKGTQNNTDLALQALAPAFFPPSYGGAPFATSNNSYSAFAQVTYEPFPKFFVTGGLRYVIDRRATSYADYSYTPSAALPFSCTLANAPFVSDPKACVLNKSARYSYVPWTVGVKYKPSDNVTIYANLSKGFRSGAFSLTGPAAQPPVPNPAGGFFLTPSQAAAQSASNLANFKPAAPENLLSPEIGVHSELFDRHLRLSAAGYYSSYANIQETLNLPGVSPSANPAAVLVNSGKARIWGAEFEASALVQGFRLDGSFGYTDPKYVSGVLFGTPVINVSKVNYSVAVSYPIDLGFGVLTPVFDYSYRSSAQLYTLAAGVPAFFKDSLTQKGFGLCDAKLSFSLKDYPVTISLYSSNIANVKYAASVSSFSPPLSFNDSTPGVPRIFGASVRYTFGQ